MNHNTLFLLLCLNATLCAPVCHGQDSGESPIGTAPPVIEKSQATAMLELDLDGPVPGWGEATRIRVFMGATASLSAYANRRDPTARERRHSLHDGQEVVAQETGNLPQMAQASLTVANGRIRGWVRGHDEEKWASAPVEVDLPSAGGPGTWKASDGSSKGKVAGRILDPVAMAKDESPIRPGYGWPRFEGVDGLSSSRAIERPIVPSPHQARLVWKSEARIPLYYCGGSTPVVEGDLAVINWYQPSGERNLTKGGRHFGATKDYGDVPWNNDERRRLRADDVILALDARTGLTRWKATMPMRAVNYQNDQKTMPGNAPAIADGRVFVGGYGGQVYAFDAKDGRLLWENDLGWASKEVRSRISKAEKSGASPALPEGDGGHVDGATQTRPVVLGDVVAFNAGSSGVWAFEVASGKLLWKDDEAKHGWRGTTRVFRSGNQTSFAYFTVTRQKGSSPIEIFHLVDPKTGNKIKSYEIPGLPEGQEKRNYQLWNDLLIAVTRCNRPWGRGATGKNLAFTDLQVPAAATAWRIGGDKLERVWETRTPGVNGGSHIPVISDGKLLFGGHRDVPIACIDAMTGRFEGLLPSTDGQGAYMELTAAWGHIFRPCMSWAMTSITPGRPGPVNETSRYLAYAYESSPVDFALADGRAIARVFDGLICMDMRAP